MSFNPFPCFIIKIDSKVRTILSSHMHPHNMIRFRHNGSTTKSSKSIVYIKVEINTPSVNDALRIIGFNYPLRIAFYCYLLFGCQLFNLIELITNFRMIFYLYEYQCSFKFNLFFLHFFFQIFSLDFTWSCLHRSSIVILSRS